MSDNGTIPASVVRAMHEHVSAELGVPLYDLCGVTRTRPAVRARWTAMRAMRDRGVSLPVIGRAFGRDHSTVIFGLRAFEALATDNPRYAEVARDAAAIGKRR